MLALGPLPLGHSHTWDQLLFSSHGSILVGSLFFFLNNLTPRASLGRHVLKIVSSSNYLISSDINIVACYCCIIDGVFVLVYEMLIKR